MLHLKLQSRATASVFREVLQGLHTIKMYKWMVAP